MKITEVDHEKMESVLEQIKNAEAVVTFFTTSKEGNKFLYSGFGESEFNLIVSLLHRHVELFELIKLAIETSEIFREDIMAGSKMLKDAIEFLKLK